MENSNRIGEDAEVSVKFKDAWTTDGDPRFSPLRLVDSGAYGEVYAVPSDSFISC